MTFYVFFPVGLFYYFNRPSFYRKLVEEKKVRVQLNLLVLYHSLYTMDF